MLKFPLYKQLDTMDCGPTCLRMVAKHYGRAYSVQSLRSASQIGRDGVNLLGISELKSLAIKVDIEKLINEVPLPCIVHWNQVHFVIVYKISKPFFSIFQKNNKETIFVADPSGGLLKYSKSEFESRWATTINDGEKTGIALLLEPTSKFYKDENSFLNSSGSTLGFSQLYSYLFKYKKLLFQLILGLLVGSLLQLILPFLTQSVVDTGIQTHNLHFIYLVLIAQLLLFVGRMSVEFIRSWILLHISTRINLSILSDFLGKLLRLPISYFESKMTGDILQRIGDHGRIESFLTGSSLNVLFSMFNLLVFGVVLAYYNLSIFGVFMLGSVIYSVWIVLFLKYRRGLDNKRFALASSSQSSLIELIQSVPELKLNNAEQRKRWAWENIQVRNFKLSIKSLALQQYQQTGALLINEGKNIVISFLAATAVVHGQMTLGAMMALQYIIGQLNSPIDQLIQFIQHYQDAKISLERLNEIHEVADEENTVNQIILTKDFSREALHGVSTNMDITFNNLTFTYVGAGNEPVLKNINLTIPHGKVTAIVGTSGSGKTTLLKLLLKFYKAQSGDIKLGNTKFENIGHSHWRKLCGTVMQEGVIFSDTIAENIALSDEIPDVQKLIHAVKVANIQQFIEELPLGYNTKIGPEGNGISQGQKQRILIARAVYKNPDYIFFDEATNALDANNESVIMRNLDEFFKDGSTGRKTVIVVAHRLNTVKNADQIIVLEKGEVVEVGTHATLSYQKGKYFELVKNQLELGN
jgi:ATP-binding cassette, subfamily B, bacterial